MRNCVEACFCCLLAFALSIPAHAGFLSALSKLGKSVDNVDVGVPAAAARIKLPDGLADAGTAGLFPGSDGQWLVKLPSGEVVRLEAFKAGLSSQDKTTALIISDRSLPPNLQAFDAIPDHVPVLVQGRNHMLFELARGSAPSLRSGKARLPVRDTAEIRQAVWHLQRPFRGNSVRYLQLDQDPEKSLEVRPTAIGKVEKVGSEAIEQSLRKLRYQTMVLSGPVRDGKLLGPAGDASGLSVKTLSELAEKNDVNLVILDADDPARVLKDLSVRSALAERSGAPKANSTADFIHQYVPENADTVELSIHSSGLTQTAIHLQPANSPGVGTPKNASPASSHPIATSIHLLVHSVSIFRPTEMRSEELDRRWVSGVSSAVQYYLVASLWLGVMLFWISFRLWNKVWSIRPVDEYRSALMFMIAWTLHRLLFFLVYLPLFGVFSWVYLLLLGVWKIFDWLLIRPVRFVVRMIR